MIRSLASCAAVAVALDQKAPAAGAPTGPALVRIDADSEMFADSSRSRR
jgi:hypothetical protein